MSSVLVRGWERITIYLPVILMGLLALGSWWLLKSTPVFLAADTERQVRHEPDYFMRDFAVKTFDGDGRLKSDVKGAQARHFPDTDTLEIDDVRIRSFDREGRQTVATAARALSNGDGSEVQLFGNALVVREASNDAEKGAVPRMEFRGEFLHAFLREERLKSHLPVVLTRGKDQFTADTMAFDNLQRVAQLQGRVRGILVPKK